MSDLRNVFIKLSELFKDNKFKWVQIAELYDKEYEASKSETYNDENKVERPLTSISLFSRALTKDRQIHLDAMMELCTTIRGLCDSERTNSFEMNDSWKEISEDIRCESYLAYVYAMAGLANLNPLSASHTKLSMAAVSTYILSLTIPGAKGFHIFNDEIIAHCLQVFGLTERIQNPEIVRRISKHQSVDIWVHLATLCDDLKIVLRYVHFKDYKNVRDNMVKKLINVLHLNHERGYANAYAANLHTKCFEIFEELINAHNGEPEETLTKLMNMTLFLHTYTKPKAGLGMQTSSINCEHISDWFISCISKYPRVLVKVLKQYIEFMIVSPVKTWKIEQIQRALEYAAKYDAALFTKCNESCLELLCDCIYAEEVTIRSRSIELIGRILQLESKVDWQMFRDEVSDIPREVHLIKELIDSLRDNNNTIKLRAVQALQTALTKGSANTQKILSECVRFARFVTVDVVLPLEPPLRKNEVRYEKPTLSTAEYTFQGYGLLELAFLHLPEIIVEHIFQSSISNLRRAGIAFMENLINLNPLIIFETKFITRMLQFVKEPTALVRKQAILTIDALLNRFPCYPIIWIWCKIIAPMLNDADPKNIDLAISCFHSKVLMNITPLERSNKAEHFIPWAIIRTMISTESRLYLQVCFNLSLKRNLLNPQMLSIIESHLLTSNSLEAWIVLNFICGKIKSKEPDALIHMFISLPSWNKEPNMMIAIEVLANCINHFSHTALNHAFNNILKSIRDGEMLPVLIGKAIDFLTLIDRQSVMQSESVANRKESENRKAQLIERPWINELEEQLEKSILNDITEFPNSRSTLISHLYAYSELNLRTPKHPNSIIVSFIHKYMNECLKMEERDFDLENERLFNSMIIIGGRLSLRDAFIAATTCNLYDRILNAMDHPPIVNTIIVAITDICKKHTQTVENIIGRVLEKLASPFAVNRLETFKCFEKLVLQDQLKLRDTLLLSLLLALLDDNEELVMRATYFFTEYTTKKNSSLFERCLTEYPFILNEYKNFESKDSFSEETIKSPLKGESSRKKRYTLYNYFMSEMDDIKLISYFGQLKFIADKCKTDRLMVTPEGFEVLKDVFFIMKRVCQLTKEKKSSGENKPDEGKDDDIADLAELDQPTTTTTTTTATSGNTATANTAVTGNVGRGRRRRENMTMEDAIAVFEKSLVFMPFIFKNMIPINELDVSKCFDDICSALAKRFHSYIVDAHHKDFWAKYLEMNKTQTNVRRGQKRKSNADENEESDDDLRADSEVKRLNANTEESDTESDSDDLPLILLQRNQQPSPSKKMRNQRHETLMEYVFNPNI